jgi:tRNA (adenine57-N1/adenine58-N1)-methyltransferase
MESLNWISNNPTVQDGDLIELASTQTKFFIFRISAGQELQTHRGVISHDDLIGKSWGTEVFSHKGSPFYILQPGIADIISSTKRNTQILYPKDIGYILVRLNILPGSVVAEAGSGSGSFTQILAAMVGDTGHVHSFEVRPEMMALAQKNISRLNLQQRVTFYNRDIREGFGIKNLSAIFLDLPNPYDFLDQVKESLTPGAFFGTLLPTANQVEKLLISLRRNQFVFVDVCEILLRFYQAESEKFRPVDRMVAHTGYLVFARSILNQ